MEEKEMTEKETSKREKRSYKKYIKYGAAGIIAILAVALGAAFLLKVDPVAAKTKALEYVGNNAKVVSQEVENEFLFLNEYSFDIVSDNGYYELEMDAFGNITSLEESIWQ